jgi:hypothetical protein
MLRSDPSAPLPTTSSTNCTTSLNPTSDTSVPASGGTRSVTVVTQAGCGWTAQSLVSWITGVSPASGTGTTVISYTVAATTAERSDAAALRIASLNFPVSQGGPPADLAPSGTATCSTVTTAGGAQTVTLTVQNRGGTTAPASQTTFDFIGSEDPDDPTIRNNGILAAGASVMLQAVTIPGDCYGGFPTESCNMTISIDSSGAVAESDEVNNVIKLATCSRPALGLTAGLDRPRR